MKINLRRAPRIIVGAVRMIAGIVSKWAAKPAAPQTHACRRGSSLITVLVLIPAGMILYATALSRLEIGMMRTKRDAARAQARLLAESALAHYQAMLKDAPAGAPRALPISGALEGIGPYRVIAVEGAREKVRAIGGASYWSGSENQATIICEIEAELAHTEQAARLARPSLSALTVSYRVEVPGRR